MGTSGSRCVVIVILASLFFCPILSKSPATIEAAGLAAAATSPDGSGREGTLAHPADEAEDISLQHPELGGQPPRDWLEITYYPPIIPGADTELRSSVRELAEAVPRSCLPFAIILVEPIPDDDDEEMFDTRTTAALTATGKRDYGNVGCMWIPCGDDFDFATTFLTADAHGNTYFPTTNHQFRLCTEGDETFWTFFPSARAEEWSNTQKGTCDRRADLALLRTVAELETTPMPIRSFTRPEDLHKLVRDGIHVVGYKRPKLKGKPWQSPPPTQSGRDYRISAVGTARDLEIQGMRNMQMFLIYDRTIPPGFSGAPAILKSTGEVIGVVRGDETVPAQSGDLDVIVIIPSRPLEGLIAHDRNTERYRTERKRSWN